MWGRMRDGYDQSTFIGHFPCPKCGSSDAYAEYSDGHGYCFSCGSYFKGADYKPNNRSIITKMSMDIIPLDDLKIIPIKARGILKDTCSKFRYFIGEYDGNPCHVACYYDDNGKLIGQKLRFADKTFKVTGKISKCLFGSQLWAGGKKIVITEGEIDCLSVSQVQNNKWPTVSVPTGAQSAKGAISANLEFLSNFDQIILMFDMDEEGRKAVDEVAKILPVGKAYVANLPLKDANECLLAGREQDIITAIWNAKPYRPDGVISCKELRDTCVTAVDNLMSGVNTPWDSFNRLTRGVRLGELCVITSGSGMGKSTLLRELEHFFGCVKGERCGIIALEESCQKTCLELMSITLNKRITVDIGATTQQERESAFNETFGKDTFHLYDHFGSLGTDNLLSKIRYMIIGLGCKYIFLDHISIVVSGMDSTDEGGERKCIDKLMTDLRSLVEETGCAMFVVSHLKRPEKKGHEEGGQVSLSQLRGSGAIAQLADMVIGLERNQQGDTPNILTLRVLKNRFSGETGISGYLKYDSETGRLSDVNDPIGEFDSDVSNTF